MNLAADINAAVAVNHGGSGSTNKVESVSQVRVVQDSRRRAANSSGAQTPNHEQEVPND